MWLGSDRSERAFKEGKKGEMIVKKARERERERESEEKGRRLMQR